MLTICKHFHYNCLVVIYATFSRIKHGDAVQYEQWLNNGYMIKVNFIGLKYETCDC